MIKDIRYMADCKIMELMGLCMSDGECYLPNYPDHCLVDKSYIDNVLNKDRDIYNRLCWAEENKSYLFLEVNYHYCDMEENADNALRLSIVMSNEYLVDRNNDGYVLELLFEISSPAGFQLFDVYSKETTTKEEMEQALAQVEKTWITQKQSAYESGNSWRDKEEYKIELPVVNTPCVIPLHRIDNEIRNEETCFIQKNACWIF